MRTEKRSTDAVLLLALARSGIWDAQRYGDRPDRHQFNALLPAVAESSCFTLPATDTFGEVGKGQFIGSGYWDSDMGVFKNFPIRKDMRLQFRGELFNAFNHANFMDNDTGSYSQNPVQSLTGAGFGNLLSANDPRINQLALKVVFKI